MTVQKNGYQVNYTRAEQSDHSVIALSDDIYGERYGSNDAQLAPAITVLNLGGASALSVGTIFDLGGASDVGANLSGSATTIDTIKFTAQTRAEVTLTPQEDSVDSKSGEVTQNRWTAQYDKESSSKGGSDIPTFSKNGSDTPTDSKDGSAAGDTTTTFSSVERIQFTDTSVALDLDVSENAGSALALYNAGFNELPSALTFGKWIAKSDEIDAANDSKAGSAKDNQDMATLGQSMIDYYAPTVSNENIVSELFKNVLDRDATAEDLKLSNLIDNGTFTQGEFLALAARLEQNTIEITGTKNGMAYTEDSKIG